MPTMWTPDGRAVPVSQTGVAAALRNGLLMVQPTGFPDKPTLMSSEGVTFLDPPRPSTRLFENQPLGGGVVLPGLAMPGFSITRFLDRLMGRGAEEFIGKESDIPVPNLQVAEGEKKSSVQAALTYGGAGWRLLGSLWGGGPLESDVSQVSDGRVRRVPRRGSRSSLADDKTTSEVGEKPVRGRVGRRPGKRPAEEIIAGGLTANQILDLQIACLGGDDASCKILDELSGGTGGGGGGRGRAAARPEYVPPDERLVQDQVEALLTALVGSAGGSQKYVDIYMKEDKRRWEGAAVDPGQSVLEAIRATTAYKGIHKNRPDFIKEGDWIGRQIVNLERQGLRAADIQQRAIDLATVGATPTVKDASVAQVQATGQFTPEFMRRIEDAAATIAGTV